MQQPGNLSAERGGRRRKAAGAAESPPRGCHRAGVRGRRAVGSGGQSAAEISATTEDRRSHSEEAEVRSAVPAGGDGGDLALLLSCTLQTDECSVKVQSQHALLLRWFWTCSPSAPPTKAEKINQHHSERRSTLLTRSEPLSSGDH